MRARVITQEDAFVELKSRWDDLLRDSALDVPFHCWAWYEMCWRHFGRGQELHMIAVEDACGQLMAVAPLLRTTTRLRGFRVTELRFLSTGVSPRNAILHRNAEGGLPAMRTILDYLAQHAEQWDLATLTWVDENGPLASLLRESACHRGLDVLEKTGRRSPYIEIQGSFQQYMRENFRKARRQSIRRKVNRLLERDDYRLEEYTQCNDMPEAVSLAFDVWAASWKGAAGDIQHAEARKSFLLDAANYFAPLGQVRIWIAFLGDRPIAVYYTLTSSRQVYALSTEFNKDYFDLSPGAVLLHEIIKTLHGEQPCLFDFTGDLYEYKKPWATGVRRLVNFQLFNRRMYSRFLYATKKTLLPMLRQLRASVFRRPYTSSEN